MLAVAELEREPLSPAAQFDCAALFLNKIIRTERWADVQQWVSFGHAGPAVVAATTVSSGRPLRVALCLQA